MLKCMKTVIANIATLTFMVPVFSGSIVFLASTEAYAGCISFNNNYFRNTCNYKVLARIRTLNGGCFERGYGIVGPFDPGEGESFFGWTCGGRTATKLQWSSCGSDAYIKKTCTFSF